MTVACPQCAARWGLPHRLLGPAGARVRCPRCGTRFTVAVPATPAAPAATPEIATALDALERRCGGTLAGSVAAGQPFADHGTAICDAFEAWTGAGGDPAAFRAALADRFGFRLPA